MTTKHILYNDISIRRYLKSKMSLFRFYQNKLLEDYGKELNLNIIELGGEKQYNHQRFFPNALSYKCSNINRDHDYFLDITQMHFEDNSQDAYVSISVLEHVFEINKAFSEIERTLKPGGKLLLSIPFAYPYHDEVDYWRLSADSYTEFLKNYEIKAFVHFGGLFSTISDNLNRPRNKWNKRYFFYKLLGMCVLLMGKIFERKDGLPLGYGIYAVKK